MHLIERIKDVEELSHEIPRPFLSKCGFCHRRKFWFQYYQWGSGGKHPNGYMMCKKCFGK